MIKNKQIDAHTYAIIIEKLESLSTALYNEYINKVDASFKLDEIIEELDFNIFEE
jgi:hypothetical protein